MQCVTKKKKKNSNKKKKHYTQLLQKSWTLFANYVTDWTKLFKG